MKKKEIEKVTKIDIEWDDDLDLIGLAENEVFKDLILSEAYKSITLAIKNKKEVVDLFDIPNHNMIVEVTNKDFEPILKKIQEYFLEKENYEECLIIQKMISKL
jgi:hypothetical protein